MSDTVKIKSTIIVAIIIAMIIPVTLAQTAQARPHRSIFSAELAKAGHLIRLWRPPLGPGEWRSIGLFRAADEVELREVLDSLPLHVWMKVNVTPLTPHPNDPEFRARQATDYQQA